MDIAAYDERTADLIRRVLDRKQHISRGIFRTLSQLKQIAAETDDHVLYGFVYFHTADVYYAMGLDFDKFRKLLAKAVYHLQETDDRDLMARVYSYVGIDVMNNGSFDAAYHYFMTALRICEDSDNDYLKSIINDNIGQVYMRLGAHREALRYVKLSNRLQERGAKDDPYYYQNLISGYFAEGALYIALNDPVRAHAMERKIGQIEKELAGGIPRGVGIAACSLRLQLALLDGDEALYEARSRQMAEIITQSAQRLMDYITDLRDLCVFLIRHGKTELVRVMLDRIRDRIRDSGILHMMRHVVAIEIAYYEAISDERNKKACLQHLHELSEEQEKEQNRIYQYSIDMIMEMENLRREKIRMQEENQSLQVQAQTDALTGIPNRLMFNKLLETVFERAYKNGTRFGVEILDVNKFKDYNDTYGHQAGDVCLQRVAHEVERITRGKGMYCARYGGDEFVIIYEDRTDEEIWETARRLEKLVHALHIRNTGNRQDGFISVSQGICNSVPKKKNKPYDFLTEADNALYAVKKNLSNDNFGQPMIRLNHLPESFG